MSRLSGTGAAPAGKDSLASLALRLPDPQDREWYAALVSYVQSLPPTDEFVKVAQLFGFLTLLGRELPDAIAAEHLRMREFLLEEYGKLQQEVKTNARYHEQLKQRLSRLPEEIAAGVKPETIARSMSESFRQQLMAAGIQETESLLRSSALELKSTTKALDDAVKPITQRYGNLATAMQKQITEIRDHADRLVATSDTLKSRNAELLREVSNFSGYYYLMIALFLLFTGGVLGATWEQRKIGAMVEGLQAQIAQLEQNIKTSAPLLSEPPVKHSKKK